MIQWLPSCVLTRSQVIHAMLTNFQDEFEPSPHRLVIQTNNSGSDVGDFLPASIGALLLQKKTLSSSGLQILEFEGMDSLRIVARKIIKDLVRTFSPLSVSSVVGSMLSLDGYLSITPAL